MANEEQLSILRQGVTAWNKWRKENPEIEVNLENAMLENLSHIHKYQSARINFRRSYTRRDYLYKMGNFCKVNFKGANLKNAISSMQFSIKLISMEPISMGPISLAQNFAEPTSAMPI